MKGGIKGRAARGEKRPSAAGGFYLLPLFLFATACATAAKLDVIQVGPWFAPRAWREVQVFSSRGETRRPWGGIAVIHSERFSAKSGPEKLESLKLDARKKAAGIGADGIIIAVDPASEEPRMGVYQEPELYLSALAIKYVTAVSTDSTK